VCTLGTALLGSLSLGWSFNIARHFGYHLERLETIASACYIENPKESLFDANLAETIFELMNETVRGSEMKCMNWGKCLKDKNS
jgi:hypothetical protein